MTIFSKNIFPKSQIKVFLIIPKNIYKIKRRPPSLIINFISLKLQNRDMSKFCSYLAEINTSTCLVKSWNSY